MDYATEFGSISARRATYAFVDVETTGIDPQHDRVVEVACLLVRDGNTIASFDQLVNPERSIPATASAVHHIVDADVAHAATLNRLQPVLSALCADAVIVAHNARFDLAFLPFLARRPVLCSMRLAMRMIPDAPNFKNQVLRYYLGIDASTPRGLPAHRALADVTVTRRVFAVCLKRYLAAGGPDTVEALSTFVSAPRRRENPPDGHHRRSTSSAAKSVARGAA